MPCLYTPDTVIKRSPHKFNYFLELIKAKVLFSTHKCLARLYEDLCASPGLRGKGERRELKVRWGPLSEWDGFQSTEPASRCPLSQGPWREATRLGSVSSVCGGTACVVPHGLWSPEDAPSIPSDL